MCLPFCKEASICIHIRYTATDTDTYTDTDTDIDTNMDTDTDTDVDTVTATATTATATAKALLGRQAEKDKTQRQTQDKERDRDRDTDESACAIEGVCTQGMCVCHCVFSRAPVREREHAQIDAWRDHGHLCKVCVYARESARVNRYIDEFCDGTV